VDQRCR